MATPHALRLALATLAGAACLAGCQTAAKKPATPRTPEEIAQHERDLAIRNAHRRQALIETIRVLEIQLADADLEVGRLQATMTQGGAFLEAYNEAYQKREELRTRLEDARMQLQAMPD